MSVSKHKKEAPSQVKCMVITVSDTRTEETDKSGKLMKELLSEKGHVVSQYEIVPDEPTLIRQAVYTGLEDEEVQVILLNGGTGIAKRDTTVETLQKLLEKEMPGYGEIFRYLSYVEDIGSAAILSRAIAGTVQGKAVFSTPGSSGAVRLAMNRIILPELGHVVRELEKDK
ncbi:MogA/MoaB family molybdenum cofactor biosynthesis protein [Bacillus horti]|uniref:Molybdenum cofactor biosynthesis protein B n=1 Tax=Caldalkalibacillus horti TaxID=77523 RepID=A0ABT9W4G4_9BACI|nr:molybdenum cofactor biosynthesis protein B [Bacillus horti]MDQ0168123.1 molybdenum cofactor biosynthesis protein B [Bacillus horti]